MAKIRNAILGDPDQLAGIIPSKFDFIAAGTEFLGSVELTRLGQEVVDLHFPDLRDMTIGYYWQAKGAKTKGKAVLGKITVPSGPLKFHSGLDFLVHIAADHSRAFRLTNWQLEAVVYHELCHATLKEVEVKDGVEVETIYLPALVNHDVEMFYAEVSEYGLWRTELRAASEVFTQAELPI